MLPAERTIKRRCSSSKQSWSIAADHDVGLPRAGLALVTAIAIARRRSGACTSARAIASAVIAP